MTLKMIDLTVDPPEHVLSVVEVRLGYADLTTGTSSIALGLVGPIDAPGGMRLGERFAIGIAITPEQLADLVIDVLDMLDSDGHSEAVARFGSVIWKALHYDGGPGA